MAYFTYQSKKIFYQKTGNGEPLIFLHGNTASSRMFEYLLPLYEEHYTSIVIDFLGNGTSDRVEEFPNDIWYDQALQTIALIEHLNYQKIHIIGTSGGAITAIHVALKRPELIGKVVADSFPGSTLDTNFATNLKNERNQAKENIQARQFYEWCQGEDWEEVVDKDTKALVQFANQKKPLFHQSLSTLQVPLLLLGSKEDELIQKDILEEFKCIQQETKETIIHIFESGKHPAILTNAEEATKVILEFLKR